MEKYYDNSICNDCDRESYCPEPCNVFLDDLDRFNEEYNPSDLVGVSYGIDEYILNEKQSKQENMEENESCNSDKNKLLCDNECLEDYMTVSVEDDQWLEVLNGRLTIEKIIDYDGIHRYMTEKNREYCDEHGLCEECRSELVEVKDPKGEYFGTPVSERILVCPKCG